ncbi:MAG: peptidoglycan DD-metalloendopeptidase family protein [Anaerovoracaceae bacterium]|jgi:hypothetical protein
MYRYRGRVPIRHKKGWGRTLIKQTILCIVIVMIVILAKKMDMALVNRAVETFQIHLNKDYSVTEISTDVRSVFNQALDGTKSMVAFFRDGEKRMEFSAPADGEGTLSAAAYGSDAGKTIQFQSDKEIQVYAAAGGTVAKICKDVNEDNSIKITHGNNIITSYEGCSKIYVKPLEKVKKGQIIGTVENGDNCCLSFEIWVDGKLADPTDYITF